MADWVKIKNEYITTPTSYVKLAKKYKLSRCAVANRAKVEEWVRLRNEYQAEVQKRLSEQSIVDEIDFQKKLLNVKFQLLNKIEKTIFSLENQSNEINTCTTVDEDGKEIETKVKKVVNVKGSIDTKLIRNLSSAVRDLEIGKTETTSDEESGVVILPEVDENGA